MHFLATVGCRDKYPYVQHPVEIDVEPSTVQSLIPTLFSYKYLSGSIYMHVGLAILVQMNLTILSRFIQLVHPFKIKLNLIKQLDKADYLDYKYIKIIFVCLIIYNVVCLKILDTPLLCPCWVGLIWWWEWFLSTRFRLAIAISFIDMFAYAYLCQFVSLLMIPNIIWCIYILYLSIWYQNCISSFS